MITISIFFYLVLTLYITAILAYWLPKLLSQTLYLHAGFFYDENTLFDNSWLTYGTDYALALFTGGGAIFTFTNCGHSVLLRRSCSLLICYCFSVSIGGFAHQYYLTLKDLNTYQFRVLWSLCVAFVTISGGFIGSIGTQLAMIINNKNQNEKFFKIFVIPEWVWLIWGILPTAFVFLGTLSMKRPACDIFIAGITQTAPSTYVFLVLLSNKWVVKNGKVGGGLSQGKRKREFNQSLLNVGKILLMVGIYLNAPLLPLYPQLVSLNLDLGTINAILHSWLAVAWGLQFWGLRNFCKVFPEKKIKDL